MDEPSRILVTGPRAWKDRALAAAALDGAEDWIRCRVAPDGPLVLVHGCAPGWDTLCAVEAGRRGWAVEGHRAIWRPGGGRFSPSAGFERNQRMVNLGAAVCAAGIMACGKEDCPRPQPHGTHGTQDCIARARKAGIPVLETMAAPVRLGGRFAQVSVIAAGHVPFSSLRF